MGRLAYQPHGGLDRSDYDGTQCVTVENDPASLRHLRRVSQDLRIGPLPLGQFLVHTRSVLSWMPVGPSFEAESAGFTYATTRSRDALAASAAMNSAAQCAA